MASDPLGRDRDDDGTTRPRGATCRSGNDVGYANKLNRSTTDGGSTLDYLMHTRGNGLKNLNGGVLGGFRSDHHAVRGTYSLR